MLTRAEQMAQLRDVQVPVDRSPTADLEVIHAEFVLRPFEALLDRPSSEGHPHHPLQRDVARVHEPIGDEVLDLVEIDHIASHDQGVSGAGKSSLVRDITWRVFDFPDDGALLAVLDAEPLPLLPAKGLRVREQVAHLARAQGLACQAGKTLLWPSFL